MSKSSNSIRPVSGLGALTLGCTPLVLATLFAATPAAAQNVGQSFQRNRNVAVRSRGRPAYDALGIRSGAFLIYPKVTIDGTYDDNIYATKNNTISDGIVTATGQIQAGSGWSRHRLTGFVRAARSEYTSQSSESSTTYGFGTSGQLDVQRDFALTASGGFEHLVESRTASGTPLSATKPIDYDASTLDFGAAKAFNRLRVKGAFNYRGLNYDSFQTNLGTTVSQDYRDQHTYRGALQVDYAVSPDTALFVKAQQDWRKYRLKPPLTSVDRGSSGYQITAGADFELSGLARGQIQGGYLSHTFDDPRISGVSSFSADASVEYFPTQLLTLTFQGSRSVGDTGLINTSGYLTTNVSAQADYELLRNLILTGRLGYGWDKYRGLDRNDRRFNASVGAIYLVNRSIGVNMLYSRTDQSSSGTAFGPEFAINRLTLSLTLQR